MKEPQKLGRQILTSKFEALKMSEDETIIEYNVRVLDIANESFALAERMTDLKRFEAC